MTESRSADHFRKLYSRQDDPWGFTTSPYEKAKYDRTLQMLAGRRFASGLEVGCSIGVLTRRMAAHCDRLLGVDIVEEPLRTARSRCADQPWVTFGRMAVPAAWPEGTFDLIVLSEVLYFLSGSDIDRCAAHVVASLRDNGIVLLVNWLGRSDDPTPGHQAAERFMGSVGFPVLRQERTTDYRLDVLHRVGEVETT